MCGLCGVVCRDFESVCGLSAVVYGDFEGFQSSIVYGICAVVCGKFEIFQKFSCAWALWKLRRS